MRSPTLRPHGGLSHDSIHPIDIEQMKPKHHVWTYFEGFWHEGDVHILRASSHAAWLGSAVFDGARRFEGVCPDLDLHCARVNRSAQALGLKPTHTADEIAALAMEGLSRIPSDKAVYVRPMYWAEEGDTSKVVPLPESTCFALCLEEMPMPEPKGISVTTTRFRRPTIETMPVDAKAACHYPNNARILTDARARGFDNALVTDANCNVAELADSNVFMVRDGEVFTPAPNNSFLNGITRQRVIGLLRAAGVPVHEKSLRVDDFREADEIFATGNASKVKPIIRFEDRALEHGPITQLARSSYWQWAHHGSR